MSPSGPRRFTEDGPDDSRFTTGAHHGPSLPRPYPYLGGAVPLYEAVYISLGTGTAASGSAGHRYVEAGDDGVGHDAVGGLAGLGSYVGSQAGAYIGTQSGSYAESQSGTITHTAGGGWQLFQAAGERVADAVVELGVHIPAEAAVTGDPPDPRSMLIGIVLSVFVGPVALRWVRSLPSTGPLLDGSVQGSTPTNPDEGRRGS